MLLNATASKVIITSSQFRWVPTQSVNYALICEFER